MTMKAKVRTAPGEFTLIDDNGREHPITAHRPTLWRQGIVLVPETFPTQGTVALQNPDDEESEMVALEDGLRAPALAELQRRWAAGELRDGTHPVELD